MILNSIDVSEYPDFPLDSPDFVFIFSLQGGVVRRFPQLFVSLTSVTACFHYVLLATKSGPVCNQAPIPPANETANFALEMTDS